MRVAVLLDDRCQPKKCNAECEAFCPPNRNGIECIVMHEGSGKPIISDENLAEPEENQLFLMKALKSLKTRGSQITQ